MLILQGAVGTLTGAGRPRDKDSGDTLWARMETPAGVVAARRGHLSYQVSRDEGRLRIHEHHLPPPWDAAPENRSGSWLELRLDDAGMEITTDRMGTIPVYYRSEGRGIAFATRLTDLARYGAHTLEPDTESVAMTALLAHPWGNRTLLADVHLLPPASRCRLRPDGTLECWRYWKPPAVCTEVPGSLDDWVEQAIERLSQAHRHHARGLDARSVVMPVTAGLDSRCNLALHGDLAREARLFHCHDLGSVELPYARRIARHLGRDMEVLDSSEDMRHAPTFDVALGPGDFNIGHWRLVGVARRLAESGAAVTIDGFLQDLLFKATFLRDASRDELIASQLDRARHKANTLGLHPDITGRVVAAAERDYPHADTGLDASQRYYLENRSRRLIYNIVRLNQNYFDVRTPALNRELMDFGLSVPWALRRDSYLYRRIIHRLDPGLAGIPYDKTGLPLLDPRPRSLGQVAARAARPYLDKLWPGRSFLQAPEGNFARLARQDATFRTAAHGVISRSEWLKECLKLNRPQDVLRFGAGMSQARIDCLGGMLTVALLEQKLNGNH